MNSVEVKGQFNIYMYTEFQSDSVLISQRSEEGYVNMNFDNEPLRSVNEMYLQESFSTHFNIYWFI